MGEHAANSTPESQAFHELIEAMARAADLAGAGLALAVREAAGPVIRYVSPGLTALLGYAPGEQPAQASLAVLAPEELFDKGTSAAESLRETTVLKRDGSEVRLEIGMSPASFGGRPAILSLVFDRSRERHTEEALKSSDSRFRSVVESAPDGVVILRGPRILYLNSAAARMLGFDTPDEGVGSLITALLYPEDAVKAGERIAEMLRSGKGRAEPGHYRPKRKDGLQTIVEISSIVIEYQGAPAVLAFARDITERAAMHKRLIRADKLAAVGTLAAGVAHEINNPLSYISLSIQYVERELRRVDPALLNTGPLLKRLGEALHGAERVSTIVRDLKSFSRDDEARSTVHLRNVIDNAIRIAQNEIRHRARLVRDYRAAPPVIANATRLEQVFLNLIVNAAQAIGEGDPTQDEIRVTIRQRGARVVVEVTDTGPGIPTELQNRIFDPFFTTKPVGVGTGLGLPICQGIVTAAGGQLDVESVVGKGTTARVILPLPAEQPALDVEPPSFSLPPPSSGRQRILVVDDEPFVGRVLSGLLGGEHEVRVALSGEEALEAVGDGRFDAIFCDVMMPGITGMDVYQAIQSRHPGLERRVIFMTGGAFVPRIAEFLRRIDNPTIDKPFDYTVLLQALDALPGRPSSAPRADAASGL